MKSVIKSLIVMLSLMMVLMIGGCKDDAANNNQNNGLKWPKEFTPDGDSHYGDYVNNTASLTFFVFDDSPSNLLYTDNVGSGNKIRGFPADLISINGKIITVKVTDVFNGYTGGVNIGDELTLCTDWSISGNTLTLSGGDSRFSGAWTNRQLIK